MPETVSFDQKNVQYKVHSLLLWQLKILKNTVLEMNALKKCVKV